LAVLFLAPGLIFQIRSIRAQRERIEVLEWRVGHLRERLNRLEAESGLLKDSVRFR
jgi:hypothetical protein